MSVSTAAADQSVCASLPVLGRDVTVPLVTGGEVTYAALDYAASAPALQRVWDDVAAYAPYYGSVHRGAGYLSQLSTDLFENARRTVTEFLDCRPDDQLIFTRSTTDSLNLLAAALPADCEVFVFETEHHASLLPWRDARVTYLNAPRTPARPSRPWSAPSPTALCRLKGATARPWSASPAPRTSRVSCGPYGSSRPPPTRTAPASCSTPPSWPRTTR